MSTTGARASGVLIAVLTFASHRYGVTLTCSPLVRVPGGDGAGGWLRTGAGGDRGVGGPPGAEYCCA